MKKSLLIFDFDGTIANTLEVAVDIANALSKEFGFRSVSREEFVELRGKTIPELMRLSGMSWFQLPLIIKRARDHFRSRINEVHPIEGVPGLLRTLKERGYRLGILTSNTRESVLDFLIMYDLELFDFIHAPDSLFGKAKRLKEIRKNYQLAESQIVMIGDEARDIDAAHKAQIDAIAVTWGFHTPSLLQQHAPRFTVDRPDHLLELFPSLHS